MDQKSFEVLIHSHYGFDLCRKEIEDFEVCRDTNTPFPSNPEKCKTQQKTLLACYDRASKVEPLCLNMFNNARECLFKCDGNT